MSAEPLRQVEGAGYDAADDARTLWERWRRHRDELARQRLLELHLGLVHHCAHRLKQTSAFGTPLDELISAGALGLAQAVEGFDPTRAIAFSSYAVPRIRGAMLDEIRRQDWRPRSVRARARQIAEARVQLERALGRAPELTELARQLGVDPAECGRWMHDQERGQLVSLDDETVEAEEAMSLGEVLCDPEAEAVDHRLLKDEERRRLMQSFAGLPAQDRHVLSLYYYEELNLREIGEVLRLTESRVSQIRTRALRTLRSSLEREGGGR